MLLNRWKKMDSMVGVAAEHALDTIPSIIKDSIELELDYERGLVWVYYISAENDVYKQSNVGYSFSTLIAMQKKGETNG